METKIIDLDEWGYYGEGGTAVSFCNKQNGNLYLKLNKAGYPEHLTREEYLASKFFCDKGLPVPKVYDFVTDGERFGYTGERIKGKMSFARILSQEPERWNGLARRLASMAKNLHNTDADTAAMKGCRRYFADYLGEMSFVPADVADKVRGYLEEFEDVPFCLHGDFNPGNVIDYEGKDYWIGINSLLYGDPCWDISRMYMIAYFLPAREVEERYHLSPSQCRRFYDLFSEYYFGNEADNPEIKKRIHDAALVRCCALIKENPDNASLYVPLIRGHKLAFGIRKKLKN